MENILYCHPEFISGSMMGEILKRVQDDIIDDVIVEILKQVQDDIIKD